MIRRALSDWRSAALLALPTLAALGPFLWVRPGAAGAPYAYRVAIVLLAVPAAMTLPWRRFMKSVMPAGFTVLAILFAVWAPVALMRTPDRASGTREVVGALIAIFGGLIALWTSRGEPRLLSAWRTGWCTALAVLLVIGALEQLSGIHPMQWVVMDDVTRLGVVSATFNNPNNFAAFLLLGLGIYAAPILNERRPGRPRVLGVLAASLLTAWLIWETHGRAALAGFALLGLVGLTIIIRTHVRGRLQLIARLALGALVVVGGVIVAFTSQTAIPRDASTMWSDRLRVTLTEAAWRLFIESHLLGQGAGSFQVLSHRVGIPPSINLDPHNVFVEVAAQYGVIVGAPLMALFIGSAVVVFSARARAWLGAKLPTRDQVIVVLIALTVSGLSVSSVLPDPTWWLGLAYLVALQGHRLVDTGLKDSRSALLRRGGG